MAVSLDQFALDEILDSILAELHEGAMLTDAILTSLDTMFPAVALSALEIIDYGKVYEIETNEKGRKVFKVSSGQHKRKGVADEQKNDDLAQEYHYDGYIVILPNYCSCISYDYGVLHSYGSAKESFFCKHILAAKLAVKLGRTIHIEVKEEEFANIVGH